MTGMTYIGARPHITKDLRRILLSEWRRECRDCGADFVVTTSRRPDEIQVEHVNVRCSACIAARRDQAAERKKIELEKKAAREALRAARAAKRKSKREARP